MIYPACHEPERLKKRFWGHVKISSKNECWLWIAGTCNGYGQVKMQGRNQMAHRVAYAFTFGKFDQSQQIHQQCKNRLCCNPAHLVLGPIPLVERFWSYVDTFGHDECWPWIGYIGKGKHGGYGILTVTHGKTERAHRLAYELAIGPIPKGMLICHKCDNRKCCNPNHLFLGTYDDNRQDCVRKGRMISPKGEACGASKLKKKEVLQIIQLRKQGLTFKSIGNQFGVSRQCVSYIIRGKWWRHISVPMR